jgi:hypothetical protein
LLLLLLLLLVLLPLMLPLLLTNHLAIPAVLVLLLMIRMMLMPPGVSAVLPAVIISSWSGSWCSVYRASGRTSPWTLDAGQVIQHCRYCGV